MRVHPFVANVFFRHYLTDVVCQILFMCFVSYVSSACITKFKANAHFNNGRIKSICLSVCVIVIDVLFIVRHIWFILSVLKLSDARPWYIFRKIFVRICTSIIYSIQFNNEWFYCALNDFHKFWNQMNLIFFSSVGNSFTPVAFHFKPITPIGCMAFEMRTCAAFRHAQTERNKKSKTNEWLSGYRVRGNTSYITSLGQT